MCLRPVLLTSLTFFIQKRQVQFGWLNEGRSTDSKPSIDTCYIILSESNMIILLVNEKEGWAGVMTLGREIYV